LRTAATPTEQHADVASGVERSRAWRLCMQRVTITIDDELMEDVDQRIERRG
jgi:hypothetical protein